jgi:Gpi18-like mannosyltransferase
LKIDYGFAPQTGRDAKHRVSIPRSQSFRIAGLNRFALIFCYFLFPRQKVRRIKIVLINILFIPLTPGVLELINLISQRPDFLQLSGY